jgi:hypothetical protein
VTDVCTPGGGPVEGQPAKVSADRAVDEMRGVVEPVREGVHRRSVDERVSLCHNRFDATRRQPVPRLVRGAHRIGDEGGKPVGDALIGGFHHDPNHLLGS